MYKDSLKVSIFGENEEYGDIFTLVMYIKDMSFIESNKEIHRLLGLKYDWKPEKKKHSPLDLFIKAKQRTRLDVEDINLYNEDILIDFQPYLHESWVREGIMPYTRDVFNIGYSHYHQRIIIPHRYWCGDVNDYLGVVGRTTIEHSEKLGIPKYYTIKDNSNKKFNKRMNLYGLQENYDAIQQAGYVVVFEAEKSVLKRHSRLDRTCVALCSSSITEEQVRILIGLDVEIILAYDRGIELEHIEFECNKFYHSRIVSYIYDEYDILLKDKESPADKCNKIYDYLFKNRIKYKKRM
jgi:hypothetical protein